MSSTSEVRQCWTIVWRMTSVEMARTAVGRTTIGDGSVAFIINLLVAWLVYFRTHLFAQLDRHMQCIRKRSLTAKTTRWSARRAIATCRGGEGWSGCHRQIWRQRLPGRNTARAVRCGSTVRWADNVWNVIPLTLLITRSSPRGGTLRYRAPHIVPWIGLDPWTDWRTFSPTFGSSVVPPCFLRVDIKTVATRCQAKMHRIQFRLALRPRLRWGTYSAPPYPCWN